MSQFNLRGTTQGAPYPESAALVFDQVLTAAQAITGAACVVDNSGAFELEGFAGTQTGSYKVRITLPDGRHYPQVLGNNANLIGTGVFPVLLPVPVVFPAGSQILIDLTDTSGAGNTVQIVFLGRRVFPTK